MKSHSIIVFSRICNLNRDFYSKILKMLCYFASLIKFVAWHVCVNEAFRGSNGGPTGLFARPRETDELASCNTLANKQQERLYAPNTAHWSQGLSCDTFVTCQSVANHRSEPCDPRRRVVVKCSACFVPRCWPPPQPAFLEERVVSAAVASPPSKRRKNA